MRQLHQFDAAVIDQVATPGGPNRRPMAREGGVPELPVHFGLGTQGDPLAALSELLSPMPIHRSQCVSPSRSDDTNIGSALAKQPQQRSVRIAEVVGVVNQDQLWCRVGQDSQDCNIHLIRVGDERVDLLGFPEWRPARCQSRDRHVGSVAGDDDGNRRRL